MNLCRRAAVEVVFETEELVEQLGGILEGGVVVVDVSVVVDDITHECVLSDGISDGQRFGLEVGKGGRLEESRLSERLIGIERRVCGLVGSLLLSGSMLLGGFELLYILLLFCAAILEPILEDKSSRGGGERTWRTSAR